MGRAHFVVATCLPCARQAGVSGLVPLKALESSSLHHPNRNECKSPKMNISLPSVGSIDRRITAYEI